MSGWAETFVREGLVVVEDSLEPDFCETVVARRLADVGVDESDRATWPAGPQHLHATTTYVLEDVAPRAARARDELVGGRDRVLFGDLPDNLIVNFPDPRATWWSPDAWDAPHAGWHKDGDWFRHFLDSPEQGLLGIVFWRDVVADQGATYVVADSIGPVARLLAAHREGLDPPVSVREIVGAAHDFRPLTARQGTIMWVHPFLVHSASVNRTDRLRVISNTTVMLRDPLVFGGDGSRTPIERSILTNLGLDALDFRIARPRERVVPERERRWRAAQAKQNADGDR
jgi:hypothetical protein